MLGVFYSYLICPLLFHGDQNSNQGLQALFIRQSWYEVHETFFSSTGFSLDRQAVLQITDFITTAYSVPIKRLPFSRQRIAACFQFIPPFSLEMKGEGKYIITKMTIL